MKPKGNRNPLWAPVTRGVHLGYRPAANGAGTWSGRAFVAGKWRQGALGTADDGKLEPNGETVLSHPQALGKVQEWAEDRALEAAGMTPRQRGPYAVADAMRDYLEWFKHHRKSLAVTRYVVNRAILPALGAREVSTLTAEELRRWHHQLAEGRTRATANRQLRVLRAALSRAYEEGRVASNEAWARVKPFKGAEVPKVRFLDREEVRRLLNACEPDFRTLATGALLTGARYGELCRARVGDYRPEAGSLYVPVAKSGRGRDVYLSAEGVASFEQLTAGRPAGELLFHKTSGEAWGAVHQVRRMAAASVVAKIEPAAHFHLLRHTYASHYLMSGGSIAGLAQQLGHADTRMTERHYGHLAASWRRDEARRHAPEFGVTGDKRPVRRLRASG